MSAGTQGDVDVQYPGQPRDARGRVLLWRGDAELGATNDWSNGQAGPARPYIDIHEMLQELDDTGRGYGRWWGHEQEARFYGDPGNALGGIVISAWWNPSDLEAPQGWDHEGVTAKPGAQGEIDTAEYCAGGVWHPVSFPHGMKISASREASVVDAIDQMIVSTSGVGSGAMDYLNARHPDIKHWVTEDPESLTLSKVIVPKEQRGQGKGSAYMRDLLDYADQHGKRVDLTPSGDFGGTKSRLQKFYKSFGFIPNKGRNRVFESSEDMVRMPQKSVTSALEDDTYRMQHRPPGRDGMPAHDLSVNMPADVYDHPEWYDPTGGDPDDRSFYEAHRQLVRARGNPEAKIHIYRALPAEFAHQGFRPGDWVSLSKNYAKQHGTHSTDANKDWPVIRTTVKAKYLHTDADDLREFGYNGDQPLMGMVSFKGGRDQEVAHRADGTIRPVKRRSKAADRTTAALQFASAAIDANDPEFLMHIRTADWADVRQKAKEIKDSGGVRILAWKNGELVGQVRGTSAIYQSEITFIPGSKTVGSWGCGCPYAAFAWGRTGKWKYLEGRKCSHVTALQYEAQSRGMFGKDIQLDVDTPHWLAPGTEVVVPGEYDRDKGRHAAALRPLPMANGTYYRLQAPGRQFSRGDASTRNNGEPIKGMEKYWDKKSGYSAFWSPHHLHQYLDDMGWGEGAKGSKVIRFQGTPIGEGGDGEPRVMPKSDRPDETMSPKQFSDRLDISPDTGTHYTDHTWGDGPDGPVVDDGYRSFLDLNKGSVKAAALTINYMRNNGGMRGIKGYGQDVEPWGKYMTERFGDAPEGWESGAITFNNPLHVEHDGGAWKQKLSQEHGGLTGKALSNALIDKGHDGVITHDGKYGIGEMVDLRPHEGGRYKIAAQCPADGQPLDYDPLDGYQHSDGSISHDDGLSVTDHLQQVGLPLTPEGTGLPSAVAYTEQMVDVLGLVADRLESDSAALASFEAPEAAVGFTNIRDLFLSAQSEMMAVRAGLEPLMTARDLMTAVEGGVGSTGYLTGHLLDHVLPSQSEEIQL